jgi:Spy/CpxP family protein refolding chaperone
MVLSLVLLSCGGTKSTAQAPADMQNMDPEKMAEQLTDRMAEQLNLTNEQIIEVKAINLKYANRLQVVSQQPRNRRKLKAFKNMSTEKNGEMKTILTPKQYADYEKILEERRNKMNSSRE